MKRYIVGIDEAGRGPLAGPVSVGVFVIPEKNLKKINLKGLRDSKKLSENQRNEWKEKIDEWKKDKLLDYAVTLVLEKYIDKFGIQKAIRNGMERGIRKLKIKATDKIFLDGGLILPKQFKYQKTIIKGDEKIKVISLASIVAKVTRDEKMTKLARKYPMYGFESHKGYGTQYHYKTLKKWGPSTIHRKTFIHLDPSFTNAEVD